MHQLIFHPSFVTTINPASQGRLILVIYSLEGWHIGGAPWRPIEDSHGERQPPSVPGPPRREGLPPRGDGGVGGAGQAWACAHGTGVGSRVLLLPPRVLLRPCQPSG